MIKLESVHIEEVRGIRKLDIDFQKGTSAISGPNGSGKSGVIDDHPEITLSRREILRFILIEPAKRSEEIQTIRRPRRRRHRKDTGEPP